MPHTALLYSLYKLNILDLSQEKLPEYTTKKIIQKKENVVSATYTHDCQIVWYHLNDPRHHKFYQPILNQPPRVGEGLKNKRTKHKIQDHLNSCFLWYIQKASQFAILPNKQIEKGRHSSNFQTFPQLFKRFFSVQSIRTMCHYDM